ncbi:MAG: methyltransferase family protein, partial [Candidatus Kryptoniota bacterium]
SKVKRTVERRGDFAWRVPLIAAIVIIYVLGKHGGTLSKYVVAVLWPAGSINRTVGFIADIVAVGGVAFAIWARIILSGNWDMGPAVKENHELITRGPYSFVRHPIYSGMLLMFLGALIWYGRVPGLIFFASLFIGLRMKSIDEEELMTQHFPKEYSEYKKRVKALIPNVF